MVSNIYTSSHYVKTSNRILMEDLPRPASQAASQAASTKSSFALKLSAIGAKIRAFTSDPGFPTVASLGETEETKRSSSRGREVFHSSGRGGIGNITRSSKSRDPVRGADEFSPTRGRELIVDDPKVHSTGRGGSGNIRSRSRDLNTISSNADAEYEHDVVKRRLEAEKDAAYSSGRGGMGNITRSRSRGPKTELASPPLHSTGRGGVGNIVCGDPADISAMDEEERKKHAHAQGTHSTGRGGKGNLTNAADPGIEHHAHQHTGPESSGRGGVGNILHSQSHSPEHKKEVHTHSTGRGGMGNIAPGDGAAVDALDEEERKKHAHSEGTHSTGRGGTGNLTNTASPGIEQHPHQHTGPESSGRGGVGNILHSQSHSPEHQKEAHTHSTGRGGMGNIAPGDGAAADKLDYEERKDHAHAEGTHSTGRGGAGNVTEVASPPVEHHEHHPTGPESTGRGGVGNILSSLIDKVHIHPKHDDHKG